MAASDPVPSVPTPTGALEGAAVFSWDGSNWQPAGAAYASVATPTGVLRGVAAFTWSGGAWQPAGHAMPGVATPTGTLDGVGVYTWNGSSWQPWGGGAVSCPTPSGTLKGIAAFYWDGTSWQPTGQAAPEVATPYGVLQGMAMFSPAGPGMGWAPTVSPGSFDLNFITMSVLDPSITFTRASTATYFDGNGVMQTAATNVARLDHDPVTHAPRGLLIEEARANLWLYSADISNVATAKFSNGVAPPVVTANQMIAPDGTTTAASLALPATAPATTVEINQGITATANPFAFSAWLRGSVGGERLYMMATPDGVTYYRTQVTLTTAWQRFSLVTPNLTAATWYFQIGSDLRDASQTVISAMTLYVWGVQVEQGAFATSYIPTTSAAVTRAADVATIASIPGRNAAAETFAAEVMFMTTQNASNRILGSATSGAAMLFATLGEQFGAYDLAGIINTSNVYTLGSVSKGASSWTTPTGTVCLNGGPIVSAGGFTNGYSAVTTIKLMGDNNTIEQSNGYIRRFRYWPRVLSSAEMQQVTT